MKKFLYLYLLIGSLTFILLALLVRRTPYFLLDLQISRAIQAIHLSWFSEVMTELTYSAWGPQLYIYLGLIMAFLSWQGKKLEAGFIVFISLLDIFLFFIIAHVVNRPRPSADLIHVSGQLTVGGYPSGHVLLYVLILGFVIYLVTTQAKTQWLKVIVNAICLSLLILIGIARIYSGQHWPSDILGGYLLGSMALAITIFCYQWAKTKMEKRNTK